MSYTVKELKELCTKNPKLLGFIEETLEKDDSPAEKPFMGEDEPPQITLDF